MNKRMQEVMQRRQLLLARIADQRGQMAELSATLQMPLYLADHAWNVLNFMRARAWLFAGVAGLVVVKRRGVTSLAKGAWRFWKKYRFFIAAARKITARL